MQFYLILALLFSLLVAVFAIQNTEVVVISFLTWKFSVSLVLVLLGSAVSGALVLYFLGLFKQVGAWFKIRQLNSHKEGLEKQVHKLEEQLLAMQETKEAAEREAAEREAAEKETLKNEVAANEAAKKEAAATE